MTESRTGSSTSPFSSPSSVRIVSTAKKYLRGPQAEGVSGNDAHESHPTPNMACHTTHPSPSMSPLPQPPCKMQWVFPARRVLISWPTSPVPAREAVMITTPHCQSFLGGSNQLVYPFQHPPHDEVKLGAGQHENTQEGGDGTVHHRGEGVLQRCSRTHVPAPRGCQEALHGVGISRGACPHVPPTSTWPRG